MPPWPCRQDCPVDTEPSSCKMYGAMQERVHCNGVLSYSTRCLIPQQRLWPGEPFGCSSLSGAAISRPCHVGVNQMHSQQNMSTGARQCVHARGRGHTNPGLAAAWL